MLIVKIIIVVCQIFIAFNIFMLFRNNSTYNFRREVSDKIFGFTDYEWRLKIYQEVSYHQMMWQFWKPLKVESFYKDTKFLE